MPAAARSRTDRSAALGIARALARPVPAARRARRRTQRGGERRAARPSSAAIRDRPRAAALLVIEHDMRLIMRLCDRLHVLDHGQHHRVRHARRGGTRPRGARGVPRTRPAQGDTLLEVERSRVRYGRIAGGPGALAARCEAGEIVALSGPTAPGKTTTLTAIAGQRRRRAGGSASTASASWARPAADRPRGRSRWFPRAARSSPPRPSGRTSASAPARGGPRRRRGRHRARARAVPGPADATCTPRPASSPAASSSSSPSPGPCWVARACCCSTSRRSGLAPLMVDLVFDTLDQLRADGPDDPPRRAERARALEFADRCYVLRNGQWSRARPGAELRRRRPRRRLPRRPDRP